MKRFPAAPLTPPYGGGGTGDPSMTMVNGYGLGQESGLYIEVPTLTPLIPHHLLIHLPSLASNKSPGRSAH